MASRFDVNRNPVAGGVMIGIGYTPMNLGDGDRSLVQLWDDEREWPALVEDATGAFMPIGVVANCTKAEVARQIADMTDADFRDEAEGRLYDLDPDLCEEMLTAWVVSHPYRVRAVQ
ncbi:hypothetical protein IPV08_21755 [Methylobacterium sp. SD274]|uniref:hypothetical protein n=1 Tax=Methylobacterium sp. SD274 TaxID=2782009 RepID=UPI001A97851D|nr:hypothetical protein [Methylobacterium sp. SD274]MBO1022592.1 hypothetical protein [Methylobacterium sp. SD274]